MPARRTPPPPHQGQVTSCGLSPRFEITRPVPRQGMHGSSSRFAIGGEVSATGARTSAPAALATWLRGVWRSGWLAAALITLGAAALRLAHLGAVVSDPFYDGAVRSMTLSWHNFFFGAVEPSGAVAIDKPPVDLWLQVASVKLLGFGPSSLKLPEALGGIAAVALLYAAVRRVYGCAAALGAALALAAMPIEVITAHSDTMDAAMMALLCAALLLLVVACQRGSVGWLLGAAAALGVAFDVKLLESLVALPGLGAIALLGFRRTGAGAVLRGRVLPLAAAGAVFVVVALAWLTATLLFGAEQRPWAIGSTNGSAWNAAFVFNGWDRITGKAMEVGESAGHAADSLSGPAGHAGESTGHARRAQPAATLSEREAVPIVGPSPTRLLSRLGPLSGERLGIEALVALLLGVPAVAFTLRGPPLQRAVGVGLVVWLLTGLVLFSQMTRLHPRYVEGFTPAVAALVGVGVAWATRPRGRKRLIFLAVALIALLAYAAHALYGVPAIWWAMLAAAVAAAVLTLFDRVDTGVAATALALVAVLAIPVQASVRAVRLHVSDAGAIGALPADELLPLSSYLRAHRAGARYEVAVESATQAGALIARDGLPVVVLSTYEGRPFRSVAQLRQLIARGEVRYAFLPGLCGSHTPRSNAACTPAALWVQRHARDISKAAGLPRDKLLWQLPAS
jgi:4-amino-4-deoxy-L-arabinose transferase-like glycosyltransferase